MVDQAAAQGAAPPPPSAGSGLTRVEKAVGIGVALATALSAWQSNSTKDSLATQSAELEKIKVGLSRSADERESRRINNEWTLKVFEKFSDALTVKEQSAPLTYQRLLGVSALVDSVPDPAVRENMQRALKTSIELTLTSVQTREAVTPAGSPGKTSPAEMLDTKVALTQLSVLGFELEQRDKPTPPPDNPAAVTATVTQSTSTSPKWANYDFDVFWCESSRDPDSARKLAQRIADLRGLDPKASGRWRVRRLPALVNDRPGYQVKGYEIRVSSDDEMPIAETIKSSLKGAVPSDAGNAGFVVKRTQQATPWYLSVFVCPA